MSDATPLDPQQDNALSDAERRAAENDILKDLSHPRTPLEYTRLYFTGFAMGAADVVPGVSGGTMAFILGVYETLVNAIKSANLEAIKLLLSFKIGALIDHMSLRFLVALGLGILTSVLVLAGVLENLLHTRPTFVFAFFAGLIVASVIAIGAKVIWTPRAFVALLVGTVAAFFIVGLPSLGEQLGHSAPVLFVSGAIAICAMILPGISGSFILLILGQYEFALSAVKSLDILSILSIGLGAVVGLVSFSRILSWLLEHYENATVAVLVGFMIGSLRLIFHRAVYPTDGEGTPIEIDFTTEVIVAAVGIAFVGFLVVTVLDHMQARSNPVMKLFARK